MDGPELVCSQMGGGTVDSGKVDSRSDRVCTTNTTPTTLELYDIACRGRIMGTIDPRLIDFTLSYRKPKFSGATDGTTSRRVHAVADDPSTREISLYAIGSKSTDHVVGGRGRLQSFIVRLCDLPYRGDRGHTGRATGLFHSNAKVSVHARTVGGHQRVPRVYLKPRL